MVEALDQRQPTAKESRPEHDNQNSRTHQGKTMVRAACVFSVVQFFGSSKPSG